jgi:transposase
MSQKKHNVVLTAEERQQLQVILNTGVHTAQKRKRAQVLVLADAGKSDPDIVREAGVSASGAYRIRRRFCEAGLAACLTENSRPGRPRTLSGPDEAALTVLACSNPPDGHCRWTHRLLADRLVKLEIVDSIAHTTVGRLLKKTT